MTPPLPAISVNPEKKMWSKQKEVPRLPLPPIDHTLKVYLKSIEPFCTKTELEIVQSLAADFVKSGNAQKLQKLLEERDKQEPTSWLARWWYDWAYMSYRDPVVIWVSYYFGFKPDPARQTQLRRAAGLVSAAIGVRNLIESETLEPEMAGKRPVDMIQYPLLVGTTRIPKTGSDVLAKYTEKQSRHILVCCRNRFYTLSVIDANGAILTPAQIESQLAAVVEMAKKAGDSPAPLGVLTADNRDEWTRAYTLLKSLGKNADLLEKLQSAMFGVCLDSIDPAEGNDYARWLWHSDLKNRWWDKSFQLVVSASGNKAGYIGEHSGCDGSPSLRIAEIICETNLKTKAHAAAEPAPASFGKPVELDFVVNDALIGEVKRAEQAGKRLTESASLNVLNYTKFGKNYIKRGNISPDAFMQMAIQYGYYKMYGKFVATYESSMTRTYLYGRTETIRSATTDSAAFCRAMSNPTLSLLAKYRLFKIACDTHSANSQLAGNAMGCDRHILGWRLIAGENNIPLHPFLTDPVRERTSTWRMSTSQLSSEHFDAYGWGPVHHDGYGMPYSIMNDSLRFTMTNITQGFHTNGELLARHIEAAIDEMGQLIAAGEAAAKPKL